jgi:SAM-dependent methyltransferase
MKQKLKYYLWATLRRQKIDTLLKQYNHLITGKVLDIGGRDRGKFNKPKEEVLEWIFADIDPKHKPDLIVDVTSMKTVDDSSVNTILAIELFEHVENVEKGFAECARVLKKGGNFIISTPFLYPIHADPYDYSRITLSKYQALADKYSFKIDSIVITGYFFTVITDFLWLVTSTKNNALRKLLHLLLLPLKLLAGWLDATDFVKRSTKLNKFHAGYFVILSK